MTEPTPRSLPEWCCSVLGTLAGAAVRRGTTCRELFVFVQGRYGFRSVVEEKGWNVQR